MTLLIGFSRAPSGTYIDLVNSYNPIAFWPLDETTGTNAHCEVDSNQDGTYSGPTLDSADCPFGEIRVPDFDGTNDHVNVYSSALNTAIKSAVTGDEFSVMAWVRIDQIADWIDSTHGTFVYMRTDGSSEYVFVRKGAAAGCPSGCPYVYGEISDAGGLSAQVDLDDTGTPTTPTDWALVVFTLSITDDETILYFDGNTTTEAGTFDFTWTGNLDNTKTVIGAQDTSNTNPFKGQMCYVALFDYALSSADISALASYTP